MWNAKIKNSILSDFYHAAEEAYGQGNEELAKKFSDASKLVKASDENKLLSDLVPQLIELIGEDYLQLNIPELFAESQPENPQKTTKSGSEIHQKTLHQDFPTSPDDNSVPENLLKELRGLRHQRPVTAADLAAWETGLRKAARQITGYGNSTEANQALVEVQSAHQLNQIYKKLIPLEGEIDSAIKSKNIKVIYDSITHLESIKSELESPTVLDFSGDIVVELEEKAIDLLLKAAKGKEDVSASVNIHITLAALENFDQALDELYRLRNEENVLYVPKALSGQELELIADAISRIRTDLLAFCKRKIGDRLHRVREQLAKDTDQGLQDARTELNEAKKLRENRHVAEDLTEEPIVKIDFQELSTTIDSLWNARSDAEALLREVYQMEELDALAQLKRLSYRKLDGLSVATQQIQSTFLAVRKAKILDTIRQAGLLCSNRKEGDRQNYTQAHNILNQALQDLDKIQKDLVNIEKLSELLNKAIREVQIELEEWEQFCTFKIELERLINSGIADLQTLKQIEQRGSAYWAEKFKQKFDELKRSVTIQAGQIVALDRARDYYRKNAADPEIANLLAPDQSGNKQIGAGSVLSGQAEALLTMHYAHAYYVAAMEIFQDTEKLIITFDNWRDDSRSQLQPCIAYVTPVLRASPQTNPDAYEYQKDAEALFKQAIDLRSEVDKVYKNWGESSWLIGQHKYKDACEKLDKVSQGELSIETSKIYRSLLAYARSTWRTERMAFIQQVVDKNENASIIDLRSAAGYVKELETSHAFNQDGDDFIASSIYARWHQKECNDLFGKNNSEQWTDQDVVNLYKDGFAEWGVLKEHLDGVLTYSTDGVVKRIASRLRLIVLGYYSLKIERELSINLLQEEIKRMASIGDTAIVYVSLVLRYLEDPKGIQPANELTTKLKDINQRTQQVALGLEKIIEAHRYHQIKDIAMAVSALDTGLTTLKSLLPELGDAVELNVHQTANGWYLSLGDQILEGLLKDANFLSKRKKCPLDKFFAILKPLNEAYQYIPNDTRIPRIVGILERFSDAIGKDLEKEISDLLDSSQYTLAQKTRDGEMYDGYLSIAFPERSACKLDTDEWSALRSLKDVLTEENKRWSDAWVDLLEAREQLKQLLMGSTQPFDFMNASEANMMANWVWNTDPKKKPWSIIVNVSENITKITETLEGYIPPEVISLNQFVIQLRQAVQVLSKGFSDLLQKLKEEKYENALESLRKPKGLRSDCIEREKSLNDFASDALGEVFPIQLDPFFQYTNPLTVMQSQGNGEWIDTGEIKKYIGLDAIEEYLDQIVENLNEWSDFYRDIIEKINKLHSKRREARSFLSANGRHLSDAANLCMLNIDDILIEKEERNIIPRLLKDLKQIADGRLKEIQTPLSMLALKEGKPQNDDLVPTGKQMQKLWKDLSNARRDTLPGLWRNFIYSEIAVSLYDLGPEVQNIGDQSNIPEWWNELWSTEMENTYRTIDQFEQSSLHLLIKERVLTLRKLIKDIWDLINRTRGRPKLDRRTRDTLYELLRQAEKIDQACPRVLGAMEEYRRMAGDGGTGEN